MALAARRVVSFGPCQATASMHVISVWPVTSGASKMEISALKPGDRVSTIDGAIVEVLKESEDGRWVLVRYVANTNDPNLIGSEDLCDDAELVEALNS